MNLPITLISRKEIAVMLGVSVQTIARYEKGGMPVLRATAKSFPKYDLLEVLEWMHGQNERK